MNRFFELKSLHLKGSVIVPEKAVLRKTVTSEKMETAVEPSTAVLFFIIPGAKTWLFSADCSAGLNLTRLKSSFKRHRRVS